MIKLIFWQSLVALTITSCLSIELQTNTPSPAPQFVTSTLAATATLSAGPTRTPITSATPEGSQVGSAPANCKDKAVLIEDVTIPDNTRLSPGATFTKTWRFQNTGTCPWNDTSLAFLAGDRMNAPDTAPLPPTAPGKTVEASVELQAPSTDGVYTGYFELHNAQGEGIPIGAEKTFWVRILVGNATIPTVTIPAGTLVGGTPLTTPRGPLSCDYFLSAPYQNELAGLINDARMEAGLPALTISAQLAAAAQDHSIDMACFGLLSHSGSDGSSIYERLTAAGYIPATYGEIIYASGYPQSAFDWWMNDQPHRDEILDPDYTEMGIGYAYNADSFYKGYYSVDFGIR